MSDETIDQKFARFDAEHPIVFDTLRRVALDAIARGRTRLGIAALWEVARWELDLDRDVREEFKLNNSYRALYARELMQREPRLAGVFETRRRRIDNVTTTATNGGLGE